MEGRQPSGRDEESAGKAGRRTYLEWTYWRLSNVRPGRRKHKQQLTWGSGLSRGRARTDQTSGKDSAGALKAGERPSQIIIDELAKKSQDGPRLAREPASPSAVWVWGRVYRQPTGWSRTFAVVGAEQTEDWPSSDRPTGCNTLLYDVQYFDLQTPLEVYAGAEYGVFAYCRNRMASLYWYISAMRPSADYYNALQQRYDVRCTYLRLRTPPFQCLPPG
ncbi:hypothetical protein OH76DRAFT_1419633 [Lentinus brumalis]|uniref:Uncharacterized protein n=1 Tax=Lentinus brumalis TaxID=2498619 RepID=A0A371D4D0_9APHY|nr:hypothetical protein OH76DRAFT_1419633 [Polyporus brumalis]